MNKFLLFFVLVSSLLACKESSKTKKLVALKPTVDTTEIIIKSDTTTPIKNALDIRVVMLQSGIAARLKPYFKAKIEFVIPLGVQLQVLDTLQKDSIIQNSKFLRGNWLKVDYYNVRAHWNSLQVPLYVFSAVVESVDSIIERIEKEFEPFKAFNNCKLDTNSNPPYLIGDFFGDAILDKAIMVKHEGKTKLKVINYSKNKPKVYDLNTVLEDGIKMDIEDYYWADQFELIPALQEMSATLFNEDGIETDSLKYANAPVIVVNYNSIYVHLAESCGGGSIYWKNGSFHWLQHE